MSDGGNDDETRTASPGPTTEPLPAPTLAPPPPSPAPRSGDRLGRYVLRDVMGHGGMGAVFRASDPELGRDVAIKVLLPGVTSPKSQDRLLEEARAMAKLRHPAVLPVFDVGTTEHGVFVAMPLVTGGTMRDWLAREPRSWQAVAEKFLAAGRGLSAAHAAGLVHRDFKPTNVLLEADGVVQVADFGIASFVDRPRGDRETTGVAGTPAYMAPEQASGKVVDARADQFSFCVSFWEGLYGDRPADAETETQRTPLSLDGARTTEGPAGAVPGWLRAALLRGLAFRPEDRWPSLEALLDEIERHMRPRRGKAPWVIAAAAVVALGVVLAFVAMRGDDAKPVEAPSTPPAPPELELTAPTQLTRTDRCATNPAFVAPGVVTFDYEGPEGIDVYSLELAGGAPVRLTAGPNWEWRSRPGRRPGEIVYLSTHASQSMESYVGTYDLASRTETSRIRAMAGGVGVLGDDIYYANVNGSELRRSSGQENTLVATYEPTSIATFAIDPTTKRIAYVSSRSGPICHHVLGGSEEPVCTKVQTWPRSPAFAGRGRSIYSGNAAGLHRIDVATGTETKVLEGDASGGLTISPDEKTIVFSSCQPTLRIVDLSTSPETVLVDEKTAMWPAVSGAGHLAWSQRVAGYRVLMVRTADGKQHQLTAPELGSVWTPTIDPASTRATFMVRGEKPGIYLASLDPVTPVLTRLTTDANDRGPAWYSATGIAFERRHQDGTSTTHLIDTSTGTVSDLANPNGFLTANPTTGELLMLSQTGPRKGLLWWNPTTGKQRRGPPGGPVAYTYASVSPNGEWLSVQGGAANAVWRARLPHGALELVYEPPTGVTIAQCAIDNRGHLIASPSESKGELFVTTVRSGSL